MKFGHESENASWSRGQVSGLEIFRQMILGPGLWTANTGNQTSFSKKTVRMRGSTTDDSKLKATVGIIYVTTCLPPNFYTPKRNNGPLITCKNKICIFIHNIYTCTLNSYKGRRIEKKKTFCRPISESNQQKVYSNRWKTNAWYGYQEFEATLCTYVNFSVHCYFPFS